MSQIFETPCRRCDAGVSLVQHLDLGLIGHADDVGFVECPSRPFKEQREAQKVVRACDDLTAHITAEGPGFVVYQRPGGDIHRIGRDVVLEVLAALRSRSAFVSQPPEEGR